MCRGCLDHCPGTSGQKGESGLNAYKAEVISYVVMPMYSRSTCAHVLLLSRLLISAMGNRYRILQHLRGVWVATPYTFFVIYTLDEKGEKKRKNMYCL